METKEKPFSETLCELLRFSKRHAESFTVESLRECLGPLYHNNMRLKDILIVMDNAFREMIQIKEFEIGARPTLYLEIIMAPFNGIVPLGESIIFGPKPDEKFTIEEFYNKIIADYMHKFMQTRVDWCREYLFPEEKGVTK